ncbi:hypothetical protein BDW02DRAFT_624823 [Decorospora gaudefroyi]|uniref:Gfd2/YDR514C-like C-terminal domain-containing protein n=1 Tax=Decorospora gaudefroyi TaxID=184978 RepID=A0A6A5K8T9_9PLEO|nr:hypothetical protein BDW02DRAFT_624823 [Decorospora gaudefroyi]
MSVSTSMKLKNLCNLLAEKPNCDILRIYLSRHDTSLLRHAILVTIHRRWSANPPYRLTEMGITTYDRLEVNQGQPIMPGPHAQNLLRHVWSLHLIIRPYAHLESTASGLDPFHFGTTIFVSEEGALDLLHQIWHQPMDDQRPSNGFRPIIYMSFGDNDRVGKARKAAFDFDPTNFTTTIAVLDAQIIPQQTKITRRADATFEYLLQQFKISVFHVENAGNAAMYATIIAFLSALRFDLYASLENKVGKPGRKGHSSSKAARSVIQALMEWPTPAPPFGGTVYCWRCGSDAHNFVECPNTDLVCSRCEGAIHQWRKENAGTHMEGLCVFR